ncbi:MAG TPA: SDR family oxidoreductase [Phycisphaerales bacterium]|nr:SDR family oxidoreductase [Phycisphaerales bacterium]
MTNGPTRVLITGGSRGIGLGFVRRFLERGDEVVATARDPEGAKGLQGLACDRLRVERLDVEDAASIEALGVAMRGRAIDVLINNAGITSSSKSLAVLDAAELARVFMVNAIAPMLVTRALIENLRAGRGRTIVQITSQLGSIAKNDGGSSYGYRASKAALNQLNRSLAAELAKEPGPPFSSVAMHPGWVRTDMGGPKGDLSVEEAVGFMMGTIDGLTPGQSGAFLNYDGGVLPW